MKRGKRELGGEKGNRGGGVGKRRGKGGEWKKEKRRSKRGSTYTCIHMYDVLHTYTVHVAATKHFCLTATKILLTSNTDGAADLVWILVEVGPRHQLLQEPRLHL